MSCHSVNDFYSTRIRIDLSLTSFKMAGLNPSIEVRTYFDQDENSDVVP